jgi:hypothetical protein
VQVRDVMTREVVTVGVDAGADVAGVVDVRVSHSPAPAGPR